MRPARRRGGWLAVALLAPWGTLAAQGVAAPDAISQRPAHALGPLAGASWVAPPLATPPLDAQVAAPPLFPLTPPARRPSKPWQPVAASALVPGAGQLALRQWRGLLYVAIEGLGWVQHLRLRADSRRARERYQAIARDVARAPFGGGPPGDFAYYERMEHYVASGAYDREPGGALEPEVDPSTYNGSIWQLARQTYWPDPDVPPPPGSPAHERALEFYAARAVPKGFEWSWVGAEDARARFGEALDRSNEAARFAGAAVGVLIANHVASTVDAAISVRLVPLGRDGLAVAASVPFPRLAGASP